ncbi:ABC transporter ATP-binding protein [Actinophytocola glycyrrhizae]|uniref:ABC transporter ATP-binding protein n=1 Tax=Actinophytocola glycyrrhizae TaxID=2044873 RepID=A0ABV9RXE3_9PSEU
MSAKILPISDPKSTRRYALKALRSHPRLLVSAIGMNAAAAATALVGPRLLGDLVQTVVSGTTVTHVTGIAIALLAFVVLEALLIRGATVQGGKLSQAVLAEVREEFIERVLAVPLSTAEAAGSGDLISRASRDIDSMGRAAQYALPAIVTAVLTVSLTVVGMLVASPGLSLVMLVAVPPVVLATRWYMRRSTAAYLAYSAAAADVTEQLSASTSGAATIEALGLQERRIEAGDASVKGTYDADIGTLRLRTVFQPSVEFGYRLPTIAALLLGSYFYVNGWASLGVVTAVVLYTQQIAQPLAQARDWLYTVQTSLVSLARLIGVAEVPPDREVRAHAGGEQAPDGERNLSVDKVTFAYDDGPDVLHDINLTVKQGERLAIVGSSGAGKSTLGRLMAGIHSPRSGSVKLGGTPLIELPLDQLRSRVALVSHEQYVLGGTLRENLELAARAGSASDETIWSALDAVVAKEWVKALPDGLDTVVGAGGTSLSPVQSQQLAIARLVVADPDVLVLDEATSVLDPTSARHLERSLNALVAGRTVIAIAHRLHTAFDAHRVAVVEDGRVVELGSHAELIETGGAYARLWSSWHGASPDGRELARKAHDADSSLH